MAGTACLRKQRQCTTGTGPAGRTRPGGLGVAPHGRRGVASRVMVPLCNARHVSARQAGHRKASLGSTPHVSARQAAIGVSWPRWSVPGLTWQAWQDQDGPGSDSPGNAGKACRGLSHPGLDWQVTAGHARRRRAGEAWLRSARCGGTSLISAWQAWKLGRDAACQGMPLHHTCLGNAEIRRSSRGRRGMTRRGFTARGTAGGAWLGAVRHHPTRLDMAGVARRGKSGHDNTGRGRPGYGGSDRLVIAPPAKPRTRVSGTRRALPGRAKPALPFRAETGAASPSPACLAASLVASAQRCPLCTSGQSGIAAFIVEG